MLKKLLEVQINQLLIELGELQKKYIVPVQKVVTRPKNDLKEIIEKEEINKSKDKKIESKQPEILYYEPAKNIADFFEFSEDKKDYTKKTVTGYHSTVSYFRNPAPITYVAPIIPMEESSFGVMGDGVLGRCYSGLRYIQINYILTDEREKVIDHEHVHLNNPLLSEFEVREIIRVRYPSSRYP